MMLEGVTASLALALGAIGLWARRKSSRAARIDANHAALVEAAPVGLLRITGSEIRPNPAAAGLLGLQVGTATDHATVLACFTAASAERLQAMLSPDVVLPTQGATVETRSGATLALTRSMAPDGAVHLWLNDETALSHLVERFATTDRQLAEIRAVLDALPVPVWWRRADQSLAGVNRAMAMALELDPTDALRQRREFHGDAREIAGRAARLGVAQTESRHVVVRGERLLFEIAETPLEGRPGETAGLALDRTALEEVTRALERHMAGHADVLERLSTAVAIYGPDQRLQFNNQAFRAIWGVGVEDLDDQPGYGQVLELLRELRRLPEIVDFRAFVRAQEALFTSLLEPVEDLLHLPDERTLRVTVAPHPMGGLMFLYQDVTDRLRLERSRNTLAEVQQATLNQLQEGVAVFGTDGRLRLWNPVFAKLWGFDPQALDSAPHIGDLVDRVRPLMAALTAEAWSQLRQSMVLSVTGTGLRSSRLERPDGMILDMVAMPLPDGQRLLLFVDVSASVAVERALDERNKALARTERLKSEFIGHVSYALRSPLNSILGFAELLQSGAAGAMAERQREYVGDILTAAGALSALVSDILDQAAIDAGYMRLDFAVVDCDRLLAGVVGQARARAQELGIHLEVDMPAPPGPIVADGVRLRQALERLLTNAFDVTREGGTVRLAARRVQGGVEIAVTDSGPELAVEDGERLFERFERRPGGESDRSGLNLSLARGIVALHNGRMDAGPANPGGARITCWLPADPTALA